MCIRDRPNELKLKYLADNDFASLSGDALTSAIKDSISHKIVEIALDEDDGGPLVAGAGGQVAQAADQVCHCLLYTSRCV